MLFRPELHGKLRQPLPQCSQAMNPGVAGCTKRDQLVGRMYAANPMMDMKGAALLPCSTSRASAAVSCEHGFALSIEAGTGVHTGPVAAATKARDYRYGGSTAAEQRSLTELAHLAVN